MRAWPSSFPLLLSALVPAACGTPASVDVTSPGVSGSAVHVQLSQDAQGARDERFQEAVVVVHAVAVHVAGAGWQPVMDGRVTVDLLRLEDHAVDLGLAALPEGRVTQARLYVLEDEDSYVTTSDGERHPLRVPSGAESGIKVKLRGSVGACEQAALDLSLDGPNAIHIHGRGADDTYLFRPVIRVGAFATAPRDGCDTPVGDGLGDNGTPDDNGTPGADGTTGGDGSPGDALPEDGLCFDPEAGYYECPA